MQPIISTRDSDGVACVVINRPLQRNALSLEALDCLRRTFEEFQRDSSLKCVILTGTGKLSFAAGGDLKELASFRSPEQAAQVAKVGRNALEAIRQCPAPVYAAINGHALGGGAELALACDFRFAHQSATLGFLQGKLNITTAWGGAADLISLIGPAPALELLLDSRAMTMDEAQALGLIDQIVPDHIDLAGAVREHAARFLAKPAQVIQAFTRVAHAAKSHLRLAIEPVESLSFVTTWVNEAHWEAVAASFSKTKAADTER